MARNDAHFEKLLKAALAENRERWIDDWLRLSAQPSVSATGEGVEACCRMVAGKMEDLGIRTEICAVSPYPVILGRAGEDPDKPTVLIYAHYDVVPPGNPELWETPPFEPVIRNGKAYGRGVADNKSPLMAHLEAYEFLSRMWGDMPVNVIFLFEGCEESGSQGLPEFLESHRKELAADLVFFSDGPKNEKNLPIIALGAKGSLTIDLTLRTMNRDAHSRFAPVLPSAAWQIVELLGKLKQGEQVLVDGFYEGIVPPAEKELEILKALPPVDQEMEAIYGTRPSCGKKENYYVKLNTTPTFNIKLLHSGDGSGVVTSQARASLDIRLVEGQEPEDIFRKVSAYIRNLGYENVELACRGGVLPSRTPVDNKFVPLIGEVVGKVYGDYVIYPCRPSTAPDYLWTRILGLPAVQVRWSDPDSNNHAPNEHLTVEEYIRGIELTVRVLKAVGEKRTES